MPGFGEDFRRENTVNPSAGLLNGARPDTAYLSSSSNLPKLRAASGNKPLVYGPLGEWQNDKGRPFGSIGRVGLNLLPNQDVQAGGTGAYAPGAQSQADQPGFFSNLIGGLFGFAGEGAAGVGRTIGSVPDAIISGAAEAVHLPFGIASGAITAATGEGFDRESMALYQQKIRENPLNALLALDDVARQQWQRDVESGRNHGLLQGLGPSSNLWEDMGNVIQLLNIPAAIVRRGLIGEAGAAAPQLAEVEKYALGARDALKSTFWQELADRYKSGAFGAVGSQQARDALMDEVAVYGMIARQADAPDEGLLSGQTLVDMLAMTLTDPLIVGDLGLAVASKISLSAARTVSARVLQAIPEAERTTAIIKAAHYLASAHKVTPELATRLMVSRPTWFTEAWTHVAKLPEYAQYRQQALEGLSYWTKYKASVEPALRPVAETIRRINNPTEWLPGRGASSRAVNDIFSRNVSEGAARAFGVDNYMGVLNDLPPEVRASVQEGFGIQTAFTSRAWGRRKLVENIRVAGGLPGGTNTPTEIVDKRLSGLLGADFAGTIEQEVVRLRKYYFARGRGTQAQILEQGRAEAAQRLSLMGMDPTEAAAKTANWNTDQVAMMDYSYFGWMQKQWEETVAQVHASQPVLKDAVDVRQLTPLAERTMSAEDGLRIVKAIEAKDISAVRKAIGDFDLLTDHVHQGMPAGDTFKQVKAIIEDQLNKKALPREFAADLELPAELAALRDQNAALGYRLGFKPPPEGLWREITDANGKVIGANPWIELSTKGTSAAEFTRLQRAKERIFHAIRGERILSDARENFIRFATEDGDLTQGEAQAMFARILGEASKQNIPPRGLDGEAIFKLVKTHGLPSELEKKIGPRKAVEMLLKGFEGNFWHVGWAQKFTGAAKTGLGGTTNWLGVLAEKIYPTVRFFYNPIFQAQELVEGPILNLMRGIKPGFNASDLDKATIELIDIVLHQSRYAFDDRIEQSGLFLWGLNAANDAFKPSSRLGEVVRKASVDGKLNVAQIKRINFARQARQEIGKEFGKAMERVSPGMMLDLVGHYGTGDYGEIAIRYLTEKANWANHATEYVNGLIDATKASDLGARVPVILDKLAGFLDDYSTGEELRIAVAEGTLKRAKFKRLLKDAGADADYTDRAWVVASNPQSAEQWWADWQRAAPGTLKDFTAARNLVKGWAKQMDMSEEEFLARHMDSVGGIEAQDLSRLSEADRRSAIRMQEVRHNLTGQYQVEKALDDFYDFLGISADREFHIVIDPASGHILQRDSATGPWRRLGPTGLGSYDMSSPGLGVLVANHEQVLPGRISVHNHPWEAPPSPGDILLDILGNADMGVVRTPTGIIRSRPGPDGWLGHGGLRDMFNGPDGLPLRDPALMTDAQKQVLGNLIEQTWYSTGQEITDWLINAPGQNAWLGGYMRQFGWDESVTRELTWRIGQRKMEAMADIFGFSVETERRFAAPLDLAALDEAMLHPERDFILDAIGGPHGRIERPVKINTGTGAAEVKATATLGTRRPVPEWLAGLPVETQTAINRTVDRWLGARLGNETGTIISPATTHLGGVSVGGATTYELMGSGQQAVDAGLALAKLHDADHVTMIAPVARAYDATDVLPAGHNHALQVTLKEPLVSPQSLDAFEKGVRAEFDWLLSQGNWDVVTGLSRDGEHTVATLVAHDWGGGTTNKDFVRSYFGDPQDLQYGPQFSDLMRDNPNWQSAEIDVSTDVVAARRFDAQAEDYGQSLRSRGQDRLATLVEGPLGGEVQQDYLHAALSTDFDATHAELTRLRAAGAAGVPDLPAGGRPAPYRVERPPDVYLPGGTNHTGPYSYVEQTYLDSQAIDPRTLVDAAEPILPRLYEGIWDAKRRSGGFNVYDSYNSAVYGLLSSRTNPLDAEAAWTALRDTTNQIGRQMDLMEYGYHVAQWVDGDPYRMGVGLALEEGFLTHPQNAGFLTASERLAKQTEVADIMDRFRNQLQPGDDVQALIQSFNEQLATSGSALRLYDVPIPGGSDVMALLREQGAEYLTDDMLTAFGDVMNWHKSHLFGEYGYARPNQDALKELLRQQPRESNIDYAMRLSSQLSGMDGAAGIQMVAARGPGSVGVPVLDEAMTRDIVERMVASGDWQTVKHSLSRGFVDEAEAAMRREGPWPRPSVEGLRLAPRSGKTSEREMRRVLEDLVPAGDPILDIAKEPGVLRSMVDGNGGVLHRYGGDYQTLADHYLHVLEPQDLAALPDSLQSWIGSRSAAERAWLHADMVRGRVKVASTQTAGVVDLPSLPGMHNGIAHNLVSDGTLTALPNAIRLQSADGKIRGVNILLENLRSMIGFTEHATPDTALHEILHTVADSMDPSLRREVVAAFREAKGLRPSTARNPRWTTDMDEWFVENLMNYVESKGARASANPQLSAAFEYYAKVLKTAKTQADQEAQHLFLASEKAAQLADLKTNFEVAGKELSAARRELGAAQRRVDRKTGEVIAAKKRTGVMVLEDRAIAARNLEDRLAGEHAVAMTQRRNAERALKEANRKAQRAQGTKAAGGLNRTVKRRIHELDDANQLEQRLARELRKASTARKNANIAHRGAERRKAISTHVIELEREKKALAEATSVYRKAEAKAQGIRESQVRVRATPVKTKATRLPSPEVDPQLGDLFRSILTYKPQKITAKSTVDLGQHFNFNEEAAYSAGVMAVSKGEDHAFTTHFYRRGRSWLERSINHPYFGMYPASYMWGKMLPEMIRFLVKSPFGVDAPLGGAALLNQVYRNILIKQNFDPQFRRDMADNARAWQTLSMLAPALPWEIPVNAPLWARRVAEAEANRNQKAQQGIPSPLFTPDQLGSAVQDMMTYAYGPAYFAQVLGEAGGFIQNVGDTAMGQVQQQLSGVFGPPQNITTPAAQQPVSPSPFNAGG